MYQIPRSAVSNRKYFVVDEISDKNRRVPFYYVSTDSVLSILGRMVQLLCPVFHNAQILDIL